MPEIPLKENISSKKADIINIDTTTNESKNELANSQADRIFVSPLT